MSHADATAGPTNSNKDSGTILVVLSILTEAIPRFLPSMMRNLMCSHSSPGIQCSFWETPDNPGGLETLHFDIMYEIKRDLTSSHIGEWSSH